MKLIITTRPNNAFPLAKAHLMPAAQNSPSSHLLTAPVDRILLSMSTPIALGMLSTFLFQVVDTYFVGQLGAAPLAALSFAAPVYLLLVSLVIGLAAGVATVVAQALGQEDGPQARRLAVLALLLIAVVALVLCSTGYLFVVPLFSLLGADAETIVLIGQYMRPLYLGLPLLMVALVAGAVLRASGQTKWPEAAMALAGVINVVFDYLLIFGVGPFPRLELTGAALATVLSWSFVFVVLLTMLVKHRLVGFQTFALHQVTTAYRHILRLGLPAVGTQILTPATTAVITALIATHGPASVAAFGVASRIESLALIGVFAVSTAITPFIAQHVGAGNRERIDTAIAFAGRAVTYWGVAVGLLLIVLAGSIAAIFSDDEAVRQGTRWYFYIVALSYIPFGLLTVTAAIFNGVLDPAKALRILLVKALVLTLPLVAVGSLFSTEGIFAGLALSNFFGAWYAARTLKRHLAQPGSALAARQPLKEYAADLNALLRHR
ncbi:MAG: MATE family efflux transporter [Candidatus Latescibacteria bacterium]|nr:MATE family efflux transporter [Candidatus Latescibacterota bacterium]